MPDEDRIRRRAHAIWEREGRPDGRQQEHWAQARRAIEAEERTAPLRAAADAAPTPTAPDGGGTTPGEAAAEAAAVGAPRKAERAPEPSPPDDSQEHDPAIIID